MIKSNTKYLINLFILLFFLLVACSEKKAKKIDFCERLEADQSNLSRDYMSKAEKAERFRNRQADFKKNFDILNRLIQSDRLSEVKTDTCYNDFILVTLIHNVQNFPKEVFNKNMVRSIKEEIDKDNIRLDYLRTSLSAYKEYTLDIRRCKEMKEMVNHAISTWKVNENYEQSAVGKIEDIEYVDCDKKK